MLMYIDMYCLLVCMVRFVYCLLFCLLFTPSSVTMSAFTSTRNLLLTDNNYLQDTSIFPPLITLGVFSATFSAALSCLIGESAHSEHSVTLYIVYVYVYLYVRIVCTMAIFDTGTFSMLCTVTLYLMYVCLQLVYNVLYIRMCTVYVSYHVCIAGVHSGGREIPLPIVRILLPYFPVLTTEIYLPFKKILPPLQKICLVKPWCVYILCLLYTYM